MSHLNALQFRLSNERIRLSQAKNKNEQELRKVWIRQLEKEIAGEKKFVGFEEMSDDQLLAELT